MSPERFRQIEELFQAAREATAGDRAALLAQADPELRREVEALLREPTRGGFFDQPAIQKATQRLDDTTATVTEISAWGLTRSNISSARAAWVRCFEPSTRGWAEQLPSR
jgi:hypothetical protein